MSKVDDTGGIVLDDIIQSAYLSSSSQDKSWSKLKDYLKSSKVLPDTELSSIAEFLLDQLKSRTNLKLKVYLLNLIQENIEKNPKFSLLIFKLKETVSSITIAKQTLSYSHLISSFKWTDDKKQNQRIVEVNVTLNEFFARSKSKSLCEKNYKCFRKFLSTLKDDNGLENYISQLKDIKSSMATCILWDSLIRFSIQINKLNYFKENKEHIFDSFIKNIIQSKENIPNILEKFTFVNILNQVDSNDFKNVMFPAIQKAILRSAETSLSLIPFLFDSLIFDLSEFAQEIGKIIGTNLHSKDETLQVESINAMKIVSSKCNSLSSIEFLIKHFCKIYNGSEGKLTIISQKYSVLKAIGLLSLNGLVKQSEKQLAYNLALDELIQILKQESIEANLVFILSQIKLWISNSQSLELCDSFWKYFKEYKKSKLASPLITTTLYGCLSTYLFNFNQIPEKILEDDIIGVILISARNFSSSIAKINVLTESLLASVILLKIYKNDNNFESKLKSFVQILNQLNKVNFLCDKFINEVPSEFLIFLNEFIFLLFETNLLRDEDNYKIVYKILISLMCYPKSKEVHDGAISLHKRVVGDNTDLNFELIQAFFEAYNLEIVPENASPSNYQHILNCCQVLISSTQLKEKDENLNKSILECAKICHMPVIFCFHPNFYLNYVRRLFASNTIETLLDYCSTLCDLVFNANLSDLIKLNIVRTCTKLNFEQYIVYIIHNICSSINQQVPSLKSIQPNEYAIYLTPEGVLYDREIVIAAGNSNTDKNMKRESKLYSYKEQMAEIEFRKELEANNKDDLDLNKLSKKQTEVYKAQMSKEEEIRNRLKLLIQKFTFNLDVLNVMMKSNAPICSIYFNEVISILVNLLSTNICYGNVAKFMIKISRPMMISASTVNDLDYGKFVDTITFTMIQIYRLTPNEPCNDNLCSLIDRLIDYLYRRICPNSTIGYDEKLDRLAKERRLTTPAFSFIFPLFRHVLLNMNEIITDETLDKCLQIIVQCTLHRTDITNKVKINLKNPQHMPVKLVLETMIKFMEKNKVNLEKTASTVVNSCVASLNGDSGCGIASTGEIFVLLNSLTHQNDSIRLTCFQALESLSNNVLPKLDDGHCKNKLKHRIFVGRFDLQQDCQSVANKIVERCHFDTDSKMLYSIIDDDVENANSVLVVPLARAFKHLIVQYPEELDNVFEKLTTFYEKKSLASIPTVDPFGRPLSKDHVDPYESRLAIAYIFKKISKQFSGDQVKNFMQFLIPGALGDNNEHVRSVMLEAGCKLIDSHGKDHINYLLDTFETFLDSATDDHRTDLVRKSVIIFMGTLAKHIDSNNPKLKPILSKLVEALSTPSQIVQEAVANCLQNLIPKFIDDAPALLQKLLQFLFESEIYGERKGAAYGIAGIVKGFGILSLNKLGIMDALTQAIQSKDKPNNREGALFAFEMLSSMLGRLFEPYIVHILPYLLDCFGDSSLRVRQAADDTAKIIMSNLSAPGVTLIYPAILRALEDDSWRKKTSSIDLLGSMAYCAPKQLSQCLPKIVPKLMDVITDSHPKVQRSATQALKQIGSVIKNPEIQAIVPTLLEALQDPANKTNQCLNTMLTMKFVHIIDPPSLALIMPVIERAFQNRSTETRKMASQIIGNMYALTKSKDLSPYLPSIIPGLKNSLLDPVPEVRSVTARALGAMVKSLGSEILGDLLPWLKSMLISEVSSVDRSGAAQGLSEVLGGLGVNSLDTFMPEIIAITERSDVPPHVKDGYIMMFIYLPLVFTQHFSAYISQVINPILKALADENEFVRETSLRAGQRIVNMYAETAIQLLLPELERGLFDDNWRIRYSSVQLLGDLLFKIIGVTGKMTTESGHEDDNFGTEQSHKAILEAFGEERRNTILSGLYMGRSDVSLQVRQASLHVWKVVVTNTPRTLKEILPVLFSLLLGGLASNSSDRQQVAARTLGDLVRKLGERILPEIIPILEEGLQSDRPDQRQGVCIGLSEIIASTSKEMIQAFADSLIPTVKKALFDSLPDVRHAAAQTFDQLYIAIGTKALDDILSDLIENLDNPKTGERTLDSLKNIISFKSKVVLPYLVPKLTVKPANTRALAFISSVAGNGMTKHLPKIIPAILNELSSSFNTPTYDQQLTYCRTVIVSITDEQGSRTVVSTLLDSIQTDDREMRRAATTLLVTYCVHSKPANISNFRSQLWRCLIYMLSADDDFIVNQCIEALNAITKNMDSKEQIDVVPDISNALRYTISDYLANLDPSIDSAEAILPGFNSNKGMLPLLGIFKEALLSSNLETKEHGANGYRDIIKHASREALQPSVMSIVGPLLRIVSDRISVNIKIIISDILSIMLFKAGILLKPFYPQIQVFFLRSLGDGNRSVRLQAAISISRFSTVHPRPDALFTELLNFVKNCAHNELNMKETAYYTLRLSVSLSGKKLSDSIHGQLIDVMSSELENTIDCYRITAASCLGSLCASVNDSYLNSIVQQHMMQYNISEPVHVRQFRSIVMRIALKEAYQRVVVNNVEWGEQIINVAIRLVIADKPTVIINGIKCAAYIIKNSLESNIIPMQPLMSAYSRTMNHTSNDVKQALSSSVLHWCINQTEFPIIIYRSLVPMLVNGTKEKNSAVRVGAEQALIGLLNLKDPDSPVYQKCVKSLDSGAAESLQDCVLKIKKNVIKCDIKPEELDDTLLCNYNCPFIG
ncbi:eIF-2-alpha kinase activator GCN1 [Blomia tropicalis]|nr:eIF-2-alpha kinase activator GCN1 [Blomia tropicalis]